MIRIEKGDTILIKMPTKANPSRLLQAYVRYIIERPGKARLLALVANRSKLNLYEDSPDIVCKVDASDDTFIIPEDEEED